MKGINIKNRQQQGAALITALFIMAICAALAVALALGQRLLIHQSDLMIGADKMYNVLQEVPLLAENVIEQQSNKSVAIKPYRFSREGVFVGATLSPQQGLFNLNCLQNPNNQWRFIQLMQAAVPRMTGAESVALARSITGWLSHANKEDNYYLHLDPAYRAPHELMQHPSELRLVKGITPELYNILIKYVAVLPEPHCIVNINYASVPVIITLLPKMTVSQAESVVNCRKQHGFYKDVELFQQQCLPNSEEENSLLTTNERYYLLTALAKRSGQQLRLQTLLVKTNINGKSNLTPVWQEMNGV